jgi:hypothetical protein
MGAKVRLTARPGSAIFRGWSGACTGTERTCEVTYGGASLQVGARFEANAYNLAFVTSTTHTANLGGVAGADTICAERARTAGLAGTFRAFLSAEGPAVNRLVGARGWVRVDGAPLLDERVTPEKLLHPLDLDEFGRRLQADDLSWSGGHEGGPKAATCHQWTYDGTDGFAKAGLPERLGPQWGDVWIPGGALCDRRHHLYCFGVDKQKALTTTETPGRIIFVSEPGSLSSAGIVALDSACSTAARNAGLPTTNFVALLSLPGESAAERAAIQADDTLFVRPDGLVIGTGDEIHAGRLRTAIDIMANKQFLDAEVRIGGRLTERGDHCDQWRSSLLGDYAAGMTVSTVRATSNRRIRCDDATPLSVYCVQR